MAEIIVGVFGQLSETVTRELLNISTGETHGDALLKRMKIALLAASRVLDDAELKQDLHPEVRRWLNDLKDASYRAEDVLDEISIEAQDRSNVGRRLLNWNFMSTRNLLVKMEEIIRKLERLVEQKDIIGLGEHSKSRPFQKLPTTSLLDESDKICGRDNDKKAILNLLLSYDVDGNDLSVISIVGMVGVGKTTLAKLVYNDDHVRQHFELRVWVCVGEGFDVFMVMKTALEAVTLQPCNIQDLHSLQLQLRESLAGRKFLLVLDGFSSENYNDWEILRAPLSAGGWGSKVVVTTQSHFVASTMQSSSYNLKQLADEDCWNLFVKLAFGNKQPSSYPSELEAIGKEIVRKCSGLPLAAKSIATLLRTKPTAKEWDAVLKSNPLDLPGYMGGVLRSLKLSYDSLPAYLQRCFAYCSIFPKGYEFEREKLVLLWMAEGLLQQPTSNKRPEDIGVEYFHELLSKSFFQLSSSKKSRFEMHDLMNDLAKSVSGDFSLRLEGNEKSQISDMARHLSFSRSQPDAAKNFEFISRAKYLRTILPFDLPPEHDPPQIRSKVLQDLFSTLRCLRVLCLSHQHIIKLPSSIGRLRHLRYLDLSNTAIINLPNLVCTIYNLQTLLLSNCRSLTELPTNMGNLINLRYLDLVGTSLKEMPTEMSRLKSLQVLSNFIVGRYGGSRINELGELLYLHGTLCISDLQNVVFATDANEAGLKMKRYLDGLALEWDSSDRVYDTDNQTEVIEMLQPHPNLKTLNIKFYGGFRFPKWLGDVSFSNMVFVWLSNCKYCFSLPPVGQLPLLKELLIEKLDGVKLVGPEFYGINNPQILPFRSLEKLTFNEMVEWEEWVSPEVKGGAFPRLRKLRIKRCPKLIRDLPNNLPSSTKVIVSDCPRFEALLTRLPVIDECEEHDNDDEKLAATLTAVSAIDELLLPDSDNVQLSSDKQLMATVQRNPVKDESQLHEESEDEVHPKSNDKIVAALPRLPMTEELGLHEVRFRVEDEVATQYFESIKDESKLHDKNKVHPRNVGKTVVALPRLSVAKDYEEATRYSDRMTEVSNRSYKFPSESSENFSEISSFTYGSASEYEDAMPMTGISNFPYNAGIPIRTRYYSQYGSPDISTSESFKVSEISQFMELPPGLRTLKIEGCDALKSLPEVLTDCNSDLQDLLIINCCALESFAEGYPPTALKSLYVRDCRKLVFIQSLQTMHQYSLLEYLCIGSSCDTFQSFPLAFFQKLKSLSIWDCANFNSISVPEGLDPDLISLEALEIRDCPNLVSFSQGGLATPKLTSILLSNCKNLKALPDQLYMLSSLQSLFICKCSELGAVPIGGFPSNLNTLCITHCNKLTPQVEWGLHKLENLHRLEIEGECKEMESFPDEQLLPQNLYSLRISKFLDLKSLHCKGLQHLSSLETLEISSCNKLSTLSGEGLPSSLSLLCINDCSRLKEKIYKKKGKNWYKIAHIQRIQIDKEVIS